MYKVQWLVVLAIAGLATITSSAQGQWSPYIGFVYPAGGQQGKTFKIRLGGQRLAGVNDVIVTGKGVSAKLVAFHRKMNPQDMSLLREQLKVLKQQEKASAKKGKPNPAMRKMMDKIQYRISNWVNRPACASLAEIAFVEVTVAADAEPGVRDIRLVTARGATNPMPFHVGQVPETTRKAMKTCSAQVLGKEHLAMRKRPPEEEEVSITVPCTMNGQVGSGEINRYRFKATKGQRLVISTAARELVPYIADAVPGWFQPVLMIQDANGKELAYNDDYRFMPDPVIHFEAPRDGEYVLSINDSIYRGREDFVYRITIGQVPFITSLFPMGAQAGKPVNIQMDGWNLEKAKLMPLPSSDGDDINQIWNLQNAKKAKLMPPPTSDGAGIYQVAAKSGRLVSNRVPFAINTLPECLEKESASSNAQYVKLPMIVNGRIDRPDDWDVFSVEGRAGQTMVAEVLARRLDSPLDSMLKITDRTGRVLAYNDDHEDPAVGLNTHHADSYLMFKFPADGTFYVHLGDSARSGGKAFAYRLRLSAPRPDFALRVEPSSVNFIGKKGGAVTVYAIRKDGFDGAIKLQLRNPPKGLSSYKNTIGPTQEKVRLGIKRTGGGSGSLNILHIEGSAEIQGRKVAHEATPADDRMQAFLWRHLVPAQKLVGVTGSRSKNAQPKRALPSPQVMAAAPKPDTKTAKFSKKQVAGRLRQLKSLYEGWLLTETFYARKVAECEAVEGKSPAVSAR